MPASKTSRKHTPSTDQEMAAPGSIGKTTFVFLGLLVLAAALAGGVFIHFLNEEAKESQKQQQIARLERLAADHVSNRRWQEAKAAYAEIESLLPGTQLVILGQRDIQAGMAEEQNQFVGYWNGQAIAELEAGRFDEAETAAKNVLAKFPSDAEAQNILKRIADARASQARINAIANAQKLLADRQYPQAAAAARTILSTHPNDAEATAILNDANTAIAKQAADQARALSLFQQAVSRDKGAFDQQALDWLREAASLAPDNKEIAARLETMASYTRTLRVPGDYATPAEALAAARDRDRIVLSESTWKGPLVISASVELQGAGPDKTIIECPAADGCPITINKGVKDARITGITFRHEAFAAVGSDRYSTALVHGSRATFTDCRFLNASGHGLAVIENGEAVASRCRFANNGWNGAAASGKGSKLEIRDSESIENFEHGIETWDGATATLINNRCEANCSNGIHADNGTADATITGNQLLANREFGLVLDSAGSGKITGNTSRTNLLGGFVIRAAAKSVVVTGNQATLNRGPGLVLEKGLVPSRYTDNKLSENTPPDLLPDADLSEQK